MVRPLTIEQIGALANVSRSTVSRVLNNHPSVRPEVRLRVNAVIDEHRYTPRAAARNLARRYTNLIGLIIGESIPFVFETQYFSRQIEGITKVCVARGYCPMVSILTAKMNPKMIEDVICSHHFDGVILYGGDSDTDFLELLFKEHIPLVQIGRLPSIDGLSWVTVADQDGAYSATKHLIDLGHRRIAMITGPSHHQVSVDRRTGYLQALQDAGLPVLPELLVEGNHMQDGGYTGMLRLLKLADRPTAVFASNDPTAFGVIQAAEAAGLTIPDDLALVGFDDLPRSAATHPPLTTVHQPIVELGEAAANTVIAQLEQKDRTPVQICLPTYLVVRRSCGAAHGTAPPPAAAAASSPVTSGTTGS